MRRTGWLAGLQDSSLTVWWGVSWKRFGDRMAGAKNLRKMKLLTAVYLTSRSSVSRQGTPSVWDRSNGIRVLILPGNSQGPR